VRQLCAVAACLLATFLGACATPIAPTYHGAITAKSEKNAEVSVVQGAVLVRREGSVLPVGQTYIHVGGEAWNANDSAYIDFYHKHHIEFSQQFCLELMRLRIFRKAQLVQDVRPEEVSRPGSEGSDPLIHISFTSTRFDDHGNVETTDVDMTIGPDPNLAYHYHIESGKDARAWEKLNTDGAHARSKTDTQLISLLIRDVQTWLSESSREVHSNPHSN
jgi:hypothetical protein